MSATELLRTPDQILGPFYPVRRTPIETGDLTQGGHAAGTVLYLSGRVLTTAGKPVAGTRVEIWQANSNGRYDHPHDTNAAPLDPHFAGFAATVTDAGGHYAFKELRHLPPPVLAQQGAHRLHGQYVGRHHGEVQRQQAAGHRPILLRHEPLHRHAGIDDDHQSSSASPSRMARM